MQDGCPFDFCYFWGRESAGLEQRQLNHQWFGLIIGKTLPPHWEAYTTIASVVCRAIVVFPEDEHLEAEKTQSFCAYAMQLFFLRTDTLRIILCVCRLIVVLISPEIVKLFGQMWLESLYSNCSARMPSWGRPSGGRRPTIILCVCRLIVVLIFPFGYFDEWDWKACTAFAVAIVVLPEGAHL